MNAIFPVTDPVPDPDPMPQVPLQADLLLDSCCGNGCDPCVFDLHDLAMDQYRQDLRAWRARHSESSQDGNS